MSVIATSNFNRQIFTINLIIIKISLLVARIVGYTCGSFRMGR